MNEARIHQYLELIQKLLECPNGEEPEILQAHQQLLDQDFLLTTIALSQQLQEAGQQQHAEFLTNLATQLQPYIMGENSYSREEYLAFLLEVLQAESQTTDIQIIYPILQKHQHLLDENFAQILRDFTLNIVQENPEAKEYIAAIVENLSIHISDFPLGRRANNLEIAVTGYETVLKLRPRADVPEKWAQTQNNLGNAYSNRIKGERGENIEQAIAAYNLALDVYTRNAFPEQWAMTQNNLATAYSDRIKGDRGENIEQAIAAYNLALDVYTRDAFPEKWAGTQNNLATAYSDRIKGERGENIEQAIKCYDHALAIRTPEAFPIDCLTTGRNLGNLGFKSGNWQLAIRGYEIAITAVEISRSWSTDDQRRNEILAEAITVYENIIQSYIELKQYDKAIEYAERSRSRRLVDLMASNDVYNKGEIPAQVQEYLKEFYQIDVAIENQRESKKQPPQENQLKVPLSKGDIGGSTLSSLRETNENIKELQNQQTEIWKEIRKLDPVLAGQIKVAHLEFTELQALITDEKTAILSCYTTNEHTHIFVLTKSEIKVHSCKNQGRGEIQDYIFDNWLIPYQEWQYQGNEKWFNEMPKVLGEIAQRLNINKLIYQHLQNIEELIIIPHLFLHLIPFAALPIDPPKFPLERGTSETQTPPFLRGVGGDKTLANKFLIRIIPSCQILQFCQNRGQVEKLEYGIVDNATDDRYITSFAGNKISEICNIMPENRLQGEAKATIQNYRQLVKNVEVIHSIHHASSNLKDPLLSSLLLGDGEITLGELLTPGWRMPHLSDVFLSCCETGLGMPENLSDDLFTLSAGFLCAGARNVISTLWSVNDLATSLFCLFYYQYRQGGKDRVTALQLAQNDLRSKTARELKRELTQIGLYLKKLKNKPGVDEKMKAQISSSQTQISKLTTGNPNPNQKPFESPFYWGGFVCQGLR
jgi:CHAT domain-containing protein